MPMRPPGGEATRLAAAAAFLAEGLTIAWLVARVGSEHRSKTVAAQEAELARAKLESVLGAVTDGITVQNAEGRLIYANQHAARMCGFADAEAMLSAPVRELMDRFEILDADGSPLPLDKLPGRRVLQGLPGGEQLVRFRVKASGEERWSLLRASLVNLPGQPQSLAVNAFHDLTELRRRDEELRTSQEWFATALSSIGDAVIATDAEGRVSFMNPVAEQLTRWQTKDAVGRPLSEVFVIVNESTREPAENPVERVLREGKVVGLANHTILIGGDRSERPIDDSAAPIRAPGAEIVGTILVFRDVTQRRVEEHQRIFLERATAELNSSLDYRDTLASVAKMAVPQIADWCAVDVAEDGELKRLAVAHVDPARISMVYEIEQRYPEDPKNPSSRYAVLKSGQPQMVPEITPEMIRSSARDAEHARLIEQLELRSYMAVPLTAQGRTLGVISLALAGSGARRFNQADLQTACSLAERAGLAITNAQLFGAAERARLEAEGASRSKDEFWPCWGTNSEIRLRPS